MQMIKNFKDIVILLITTGVLILLGTIIIGDYIVALRRKQTSRRKCNNFNEDVCHRINWRSKMTLNG
jgi:hypothetical protein